SSTSALSSLGAMSTVHLPWYTAHGAENIPIGPRPPRLNHVSMTKGRTRANGYVTLTRTNFSLTRTSPSRRVRVRQRSLPDDLDRLRQYEPHDPEQTESDRRVVSPRPPRR